MAVKAAARTPRERCGLVFLPRDARGRVMPIDALRRFAEKCRFDPLTGCVLWEGGTTSGKGATKAVYGSFKDGGRRWSAHRWAAVHIHGLNIDGLQAGHNCPHGPQTLCVQHVAGETQAENLAEQMARGTGVCAQSAETRQFWLFVSLGIEELRDEPAPIADNDQIPFYEPPAWLRPYLPEPERNDECPF